MLLLSAPDVAAPPALRESSAAKPPSWLLSLLMRVSLA
jgi:hypothetical protein